MISQILLKLYNKSKSLEIFMHKKGNIFLLKIASWSCKKKDCTNSFNRQWHKYTKRS